MCMQSLNSSRNYKFDYIIVGAGAAGCILANRLTESGKYTVLLIEAGPKGSHPFIKIPAGFSKLMTNKKFNWNFETASEENTLNRKISVPRGKGLGGSTLINGMIYVRGIAEDFDFWEQQGAKGWAFKDVAPFFEKLENWQSKTQKSKEVKRGVSGPMHICEVSERSPIATAFIDAAQQYGLPLNPDYNIGDQLGVGYYQVLQKGGSRWSVVDGYLDSIKKRKNLTIQTNARVLKLDLLDKKCVGVQVQYADGSIKHVAANLEVILSAGTIQTPQLLELSGIGNPAVLEKIGIPVLHAAPNVGENYIDHFCTRMNWRVQNTKTLNELSRGTNLVKELSKYALSKKGILSLGTGLVYGFIKSNEQLEKADVQLFFVHASYANAADRKLDKLPGMTVGVAQLRPKSVGSIHIPNKDPNSLPIIKPNFLSIQEDIDSIVGGMKVVREIVGQTAMGKYVDYEMAPGAKTVSDEDWLQFARENGQTIYHPIGTCRMGDDCDAVVNSDLSFKGIHGLRIVDASVMPSMVSGNTQAAVMMIAEKGAAHILNNK